MNNRGSSAVFLCSVFVAFVLVTGILVDIAGFRISKVYSERILDLAARSVLAEYDNNLKNEYGLFGVNLTGSEIEEKIAGYMHQMFISDSPSNDPNPSIDTFGFKADSVDCDLNGYSLLNMDLFENQVLDLMKYRSLTGEMDDFSNSIDTIQEASSSMELMEKAVIVYNELSKIDNILNDLRENSDGWHYHAKNFIQSDCFVKKIAISKTGYKNSLWSLLSKDQTNALIKKTMNEKELKEMTNQYIKDEYQILYSSCLKTALIQVLKSMNPNDDEYQKIVQCIEGLSMIKTPDLDQYVKVYNDMSHSCDSVLFNLGRLKTSAKNVSNAISAFENYANSNKDHLGPAGTVIFDQIKTIENLLGDNSENKVMSIQRFVTSNKNLLEAIILSYDDETMQKEMQNKARKYGSQISSKDVNISEIKNDISRMINVDPKYKKYRSQIISSRDSLIKHYDCQYSIELFSGEEIKNVLKNVSVKNQNDIREEVPELIETTLKKDDTKDRILKNEYIINSLPSQMISKSESYNGDYSFKEDNQLDNFSFTSLLTLKNTKETLFNLRNNLLINEYILTYLSNHLEKGSKERFFSNEAEYVLYGNMSNSANYRVFKENFFALRTAMNLMHIYSDPVKRAQVIEAAAAVSGGVGVYFTQFMIASAWASAESVNDLKLIENGKEVAFVKSKETWAISFENIGKGSFIETSSNTQGSKSPNLFSYKDYLRLFLLIEGKGKKIMRTMDIIQINMKGWYYKNFDLSDYLGAICVNANISKKNIFLNKPAFKVYLNNQESGRRTFNIKVVHSY